MKLFNDTVYRIYNKHLEKFSTGGRTPSYSKNGKVWRTKAALNAHLNFVDDPEIRYKDCSICIDDRSDESTTYINMKLYLEDLFRDQDTKKLTRDEKIMNKLRSKYIGRTIVNMYLGQDNKLYSFILDNKEEVRIKDIYVAGTDIGSN